MKKIGLVQINNSFANQNYLPYSVGLLQAYIQKYLPKEYTFLTPIYKRIQVGAALRHLQPADIVLFSAYLWNFNLSLEIAKNLSIDGDRRIIFGGPQISKDEGILKNLSPYVNSICFGEGESSILSLLKNDVLFVHNKNRMPILDDIPSPYLEGVFAPLMKSQKQDWVALWETNRGCPFSCAYCNWGSATKTKILTFSLDRLFAEIDWFSRNKIEFIFCCDANFGILERDIKIVEYIAKNKKKYGYPKKLSLQNNKNYDKKLYEICKIMVKSDLSKGITMSLQSLNKRTLNAINRVNVPLLSFKKFQYDLKKEKIDTLTDLIIGLPLETYNSFTDGTSKLIESGQHNRIQFNNLTILPNSEMNEQSYRKKYKLETVKSKLINLHGSTTDNIFLQEKHEIVIGNSTMSYEEWKKIRVFSWMTALLYFNKLLQVPLILLNTNCKISYRTMIESFINTTSSPFIQKLTTLLEEKASAIKRGEAEFCRSEWLDIWWPMDELLFIEICAKEGLDTFYRESYKLLAPFNDSDLVRDALILNRALIKLPFQKEDIILSLESNILEVYKNALQGKKTKLTSVNHRYTIECSSEYWGSWQDWCKYVVWYGNKRGDYLYRCH